MAPAADGRTRHGPGQHSAPALDASMSLLNEVMYRPVDVGYAEAASRPPAELGPTARRTRAVVHLLLAVLLGVITVSAVSVLRAPRPDAVEGHALLQEQIAERSAVVADLQDETAALRAEISALQADAVAAQNPALFARLEESELASGALPVAGPGLVVTLDDPDQVEELDEASRVQAIDLQVVANGLWSAGAEAIAINGERLTALSAIRGAGPAVLVDLAPLVPPYRVEAIGDVRELQTGLARSGAAGHISSISAQYGISSGVRAEQRLELPGAGSSRLRFATAADTAATTTDEDVTSSAPPDGGTS